MKKLSLLLLVCANFAVTISSYAITTIDINQGIREPLPLAVTDFIGSSEDAKEMGRQITRVIEDDLRNSGLFRPLDKSSFIDTITDLGSVPNFISWRQIGSPVLVTGSISFIKPNKAEVKFLAWDTYGEEQIAGTLYAMDDIKLWRKIAHKISDEIYKRLTGDTGYFDTRIAYISETGPGTKRIKRLAIMDQDGANNEFLTDGRQLVLTPRFSPNGQHLLYLAFVQRKKPQVYMMDLLTKRSKLLGHFPGMTLAPRFSPDSKTVAMSVSYDGNTDLYLMDIETSATTRLTNDRSIDVSPSFSPDGQNIVFASDRGGSPQLYIMSKDGSNVRRISFGTGIYTTPVWSPRGDYIAFTKQVRNGGFYIGVMKPDGSGERTLAQGYLVEGPTWSPNGRLIMFTRVEPSYSGKVGTSRIYSIDLTGYNEREIITPTDASDPAWSPLLP